MRKSNLIKVKTQAEVFYTLCVLSNNTDDLATEIADLVESNKERFQHVPVVLEIVNPALQANELAVLIEILAQNTLVVVGIRTNKQPLIDFAKFSGLAIFDKPPKLEPTQEKIKPHKTPELSQNTRPRMPKIIAQRIVKSTQVLAEEEDLVILNTVEADAEIISSGSIAAYKTVHGKVFAGIYGDEKATIFISKFNAQLISIAGIYKKFDKTPAKLEGRQVMIDLHKGQLKFQII